MQNTSVPSSGKIRTNLTIDPELYNRVRKHCDSRYRSFSATVEMCLAYYIEAVEANPAAEFDFSKEVA